MAKKTKRNKRPADLAQKSKYLAQAFIEQQMRGIKSDVEETLGDVELKLKNLTETGLEAWQDLKQIASRTWIELYDVADKAKSHWKQRSLQG